MTAFDKDLVLAEQAQVLALNLQGFNGTQIANKLGLNRHQVSRRLSAALKRDRLDPALAQMLSDKGIVDLAGLHSGWLMEKDGTGSGHSLYFMLGPDAEKINFVDAIMEVLSDIPKLPKIKRPKVDPAGTDFANWLMLADLHVGGEYGDERLEHDFNYAIDDLVRRMPAAEHAVFMELGDLLDANDHKGVTPTSGNPCDVKRDDHLQNTKTAIKLCRRAIYRLLECHQTVEAHFIKGNHDTTAYMAVMLALSEHFKDNLRVTIVVTDDEYRVIEWGLCAAFPHHGDTIKWDGLKDVFCDQFADAWAKAKMHRHIMTAHFHHDRKRDLIGCVAEQFRTLHRPNGWAKAKGLLSRGSLTALTMHKEWGEEHRTISNIRNTYAGNRT